MDETPDQILARLQRHADSIRRATAPTAAPVAPGPHAVPVEKVRAEPVSPTKSGLPPKSLLKTAAGPVYNKPAAAPMPAAGPRVVHWGGDPPADFIPGEPAHGPRFGLIVRTIAGQALAVFSCVIALIVSIYLSVAAAFAVAAVLTVIGVIGALRRVPFSGWCTLGIVIGWVLGRFS